MLASSFMLATASPNWVAGWALILLAFLTGAGIGLGFHKPTFLGGYDSLRRRMVRLGHIALAALGMMNVLYGLTPQSYVSAGEINQAAAQYGLIIGAIAMPTVCFLTAWKPVFRHLFFVPVASLTIGVGAILLGGIR